VFVQLHGDPSAIPEFMKLKDSPRRMAFVSALVARAITGTLTTVEQPLENRVSLSSNSVMALARL